VIVNPQQAGDEFPSKNLAGVGVMFYVLLALRARLREQNWFEEKNINEPNLASYLDLVALGSVADMVPLDRNNRIMVSQGLSRIQSGRCNTGIRALLYVSGRNKSRIQATDLGFSVAPRLNAAGRLTDMSLGIECLLTDEDDKAIRMAKELDKLNKERRKIQADMQEQALIILDEFTDDAIDDLPAGLCLFNPDWHSGIVGIVAGKIKEKIHRPVIVFAREQGNIIKGSARSIPGIHIKDVLDMIATETPELIKAFGGHAMAAGLTLEENKLEDFKIAFQKAVMEFSDEESLTQHQLTDGELDEELLTMSFTMLIQNSGPWGQSFPEPCFEGEFNVVNKRIVGGNHLKLDLRRQDSANVINAIAFNITDETWPDNIERVQTAYRLDINEFRGVQSLQLILDVCQPSGEFDD